MVPREDLFVCDRSRMAFHCGAWFPEVLPDPLVSSGDSSRLIVALVLAIGALIFHCEHLVA